MTTTRTTTALARPRLPVVQLLVLAAAGFMTMLTETVPAGLLTHIGHNLSSNDSVTGQLLTAYAGASTIAAIPLVAATAVISRKRLVVATVVGVAIANLVTALAPTLWVAVAARVLGGGAAALQWAILAGFAMRLVAPQLQGRALSVSMGGIPLALAIGVPLGTGLGEVVSWRIVFISMTVVGILLGLAALAVLPHVDAGGAVATGTFRKALSIPGIIPVLLCAGAFQLGHMNLYTYVEPFLADKHGAPPVSLFLLALGLAAMAGLFLTGMRIDRALTGVTIVATGLFALGMLLCALVSGVSMLMIAAIVWGFGLGASPTAYQTACARVAGPLVDRAQSLLVTIFNAGMALGSAIGGVVLARLGSSVLAWLSLAVFLLVMATLTATRKRSLPTDAATFDAEPVPA